MTKKVVCLYVILSLALVSIPIFTLPIWLFNIDRNLSESPHSVWGANDEITFCVIGDDEPKKTVFFECENCHDCTNCIIYSNIKAEILIDGKTYNCWVESYYGDEIIYLVSSEIPEIVTLEAVDTFIIAKLSVRFKSSKHFVATVVKSDVLEVGKIYDFYRLENE